MTARAIARPTTAAPRAARRVAGLAFLAAVTALPGLVLPGTARGEEPSGPAQTAAPGTLATPNVAGAARPATPPAGDVTGPPPGDSAAAGFVVRRAASPLRVDGVMDEPAWDDAARLAIAYEWFPVENGEPAAATECRVTYDDDRLWLGCIARDPDPGAIRATVGDRDRIMREDHVLLIIDPFRDRRRGYYFGVNPHGVQADGAIADGVWNNSWDGIWESAGRVTEDGYVVEAAIPFRSLRFPGGAGPQTWGVLLLRFWPRSAMHQFASVPDDRNESCLLCQAGALTGLEGIRPGRDVELAPTLTASRADRAPAPGAVLDAGDPTVEAGLTARWGITPDVTLGAAINPDFSQVEADAAQLTANERFALSVREARPFFLDGADFFATPETMVFTRTVVDPVAGIKLTGRHGRNGAGVFLAADRVNALLFPSNQGTGSVLLDDDVATAALRYRRDVGAASSVGFLYTGRAGDGYGNHTAGVDGTVRLSASNTLRFQYARSLTEYPDSTAARFGQPDGTFGGGDLLVQFNHQSRAWLASVRVRDVDPGFRADAGFIPRVDARGAGAQLTRLLWGAPGSWYNRISLSARAQWLEDHRGITTDQEHELSVGYLGPRQLLVTGTTEFARRYFGGQTFELLSHGGMAELRPSGALALRLHARAGQEIDFANARRARILQLGPAAELRIGAHLAANLSHTLRRLSLEQGGTIFDARVSEARLWYNPSVRTMLRGTVQHRTVSRDPAVYRNPVPAESSALLLQLLFSYKVNPQTVLLLGYSEDRTGGAESGLEPTGRGFFLKVGYALRP